MSGRTCPGCTTLCAVGDPLARWGLPSASVAAWFLTALAPWVSTALALSPGGLPEEALPARSLLVDEASDLSRLDSTNRLVRLALPDGQLSPEGFTALCRWVRQGGTLWVHSSTVARFGPEVVTPSSPLEQAGKARSVGRHRGLELLEGVEKVMYSLEPHGVMVKLSSGAIGRPLLQVEDTPVRSSEPVYVAVEAPLGLGRVIFRPAVLHPNRLDGARFLQNLCRQALAAEPRTDLPLQQLEEASRLLEEGGERSRGPSGAKDPLRTLLSLVYGWQSAAFAAAGQTSEALSKAQEASMLDESSAHSLLADLTGQSEPGSRSAGSGDSRAALARPLAELERFAAEVRREAQAAEARSVAQRRSLSAQVVLWRAAAHLSAGEMEASCDLLATLPADLVLPEATVILACAQAEEADRPRQPSPERAEKLVAASRALRTAAAIAAGERTPFLGAPWLREAAQRLDREAQSQLDLPTEVTLTAHFVLRHEPREPRVAELAASMERAWKTCLDFGLRIEDAEVIVFPDKRRYLDYWRRQGEEAREWEGAASLGRQIVTFRHAPQEMTRLLAHEFAHVCLFALTEGGVTLPPWLEEGIARRLEPVAHHDEQVVRRAARTTGLLTLGQLFTPPTAIPKERVPLFYAESASFVGYLVQRFGSDKLLNVVQDLGWGASISHAVHARLGASQEDLFRDWTRIEAGAR